MNVNIETSAVKLKKQLFTLKSNRKDGLILQLHYSVSTKERQQHVRFTQACFNNLGQILVCATFKGDLFVIHFTQSKFWFLININSCTVLQFSAQNNKEIIAGIYSGLLYIIDIEKGEITGKLVGHSYPVSEVSFSNDFLCVTSSNSEAIIWDLRNYSKIQVLSLSQDTALKHVIFMPVSSNILSCFNDDSIHIWKFGTFEPLKQILPASWNKFSLKCITFTRNGRAMLLAGHSPNIMVYLLDTWNLSKTITLPDYIHGVKNLEFISQPFDGGSNRLLAILSSNGIIYFYDMHSDSIIGKISIDVEILKCYTSSDGQYIACVLSSGFINVYLLATYVLTQDANKCKEQKSDNKIKFKISQVKKSSSAKLSVREKLNSVLDSQKLQYILKEFGEYPDAYRLKIWSQLLQLPNNLNQYNLSVNHMSKMSFEDLHKNYPMEDKLGLKNLKKVLTNLVTWCPFFAEVNFLPIFVFPFVKVFKNEPVLCFEAICTILVNWCQHWFEYYPLPPINTLAMVENTLLEHDPELLNHLTNNQITSKTYAWTLLETAFSEVLVAYDWLVLWDHILSNEPSYLLMVVVAYNIIHRNVIKRLHDFNETEVFYHNQNPLDVKKLIAKAFSLLNTTSDTNHPRQYLNYFKKLDSGVYPKFIDYPQAVIDYQSSLKDLRQTSRILEFSEHRILNQRASELSKLKEMKKNLEEKVRLEDLENLCKEKLASEREIIASQRRRLENLRRQVHDEEIEILTISRDTIQQKTSKDKQRSIEKILSKIEDNRTTTDLRVLKAEGDLIKHYAELLRHKQQIEELLNSDTTSITSKDQKLLEEQQKKLVDEIEKIQNASNSKTHLKQLNIATGLVAMDNIINKVEIQLEKQMEPERGSLQNKTNVKQLELEIVDLELEIKKLLDLLKHEKTSENNNSDTTEFKLLRNVIKQTKDGYEGRPVTPVS